MRGQLVVFKRMLRAFGVGGPSVDTVLADPNSRPGTSLTGEVRIVGGDHDANIEQVALGLVTRVEVESGDNERNSTVEFHRLPVTGAFRLAAGQRMSVPFQFPVPWETPVTHVYGQPLHGMTLGLRTDLSVAGALDKGDLDPVAVHPLPSQERVLEAFGQLGFRFKRADLERGRLHGVHQRLPFFQEIEFFPPAQFAGRINEVELTFVASPEELAIVLEADKRGGFLSSGHDAFGRFHVRHDEAMHFDWINQIGGWLSALADRRAAGFHGEHGHRHGPGMGAVVGGAAAGLVGGMVLGEVFDEIGDFFEGD